MMKLEEDKLAITSWSIWLNILNDIDNVTWGCLQIYVDIKIKAILPVEKSWSLSLFFFSL